MDIIYLHDLKIDCVLGIWEWERRTTQTVTVDLDLGADVCKAAGSDRIEDTVDYKAIAKRLIAFVGDSRFGLVETLAEQIAGIVLKEFPVRWVRVRVNKKGAIRGASDVGVIVERGEKQ
jgi:7,8-dihydroneopterin aldolase/epimerase/oxygenase